MTVSASLVNSVGTDQPLTIIKIKTVVAVLSAPKRSVGMEKDRHSRITVNVNLVRVRTADLGLVAIQLIVLARSVRIFSVGMVPGLNMSTASVPHVNLKSVGMDRNPTRVTAVALSVQARSAGTANSQLRQLTVIVMTAQARCVGMDLIARCLTVPVLQNQFNAHQHFVQTIELATLTPVSAQVSMHAVLKPLVEKGTSLTLTLVSVSSQMKTPSQNSALRDVQISST